MYTFSGCTLFSDFYEIPSANCYVNVTLVTVFFQLNIYLVLLGPLISTILLLLEE